MKNSQRREKAMRTNTRKFRLALTVLTLATLLLLVFAAVGWADGTHSATEPTWYYRGVVTNDAGAKMKHVTVVHDPLGLQGVTGNPKFMMWWGTSSPDQSFAATSSDGVNWSGTDTARTKLSVTFPGTVVPVYHPEVIYDRLGFAQKKSAGTVHFKMWFYDGGYEGGGSYNWMRYAESADGTNWQVYEDSPDAASSGKNYLEFSGGAGNEVSVLYKRGGTGIIVNSTDQEYVGYQATSVVGVSSDGAWFATASDQGGGPTDVCREMVIAGPDDSVNYRAWDDLPGDGDLTSWDSATGLSWNSPQAGNAPISGASWSDFYGALSVVVVGDRYYMYDTMNSDNYSVGLLIAPLVPPTEVWVDDDWTSQTDVDASDPSLIWQYDAFNSIQDGIDAVAGSTVHVAAGTYDSSVETFPININKSLTLLGAQANVDPRPSQGGRTSSESIVDADEISSAVVRIISASDVEINGFTITGGTKDMVEESGHANNLLFRYNILYDDLATCTPGDEAIQIKYSDGVVMEYNYAYNICEDAFNLSSSSNGVVRYNEAHDIYSQNAAIYCYDATNIDIIGNLVYNVPNNDGIKLGDSDDGSTGGIVESNEVHDAAEDGITIYASSVAVENNTIYNCDSENGALYLYGADNSTVTNNRIYNNDAIGLLIKKSSNVTVSENNIYDNDDTNDTKYIGSSGIWLTSDASTTGINNNCITGNADFGVKNEATTDINAENDWWGDASGPFHTTLNPGGTGNAVSDGVDFDPWLSAPIESVCPPPDDEGPITSNVVATPNPAPVNTAIVLTANVDDSTTGGSNIASAEYNIDGGSFVAMNAQDGCFDEVSEDVEATVPAFAAAGTHEVCVRGKDAAGNAGSETCITLSVNAPPSMSADGPYDDNEGSPISLAGQADDPDGPSLTTTWTYVPVANVDEGAICEFGDANALETTFTCTDDGTYRVTLTGDDGINSPVEANADVTVHNVEPEVAITNPVDGDLFAVDTTVNLSAAFTDASINDTHDCSIDWDDGAPEPGTVSEDNGAGTCDGSHLYSTAGVYAIQVTVTDDDGGATTESVMVVVYDPDGGFVTGGGWIDSPEGASPAVEGDTFFNGFETDTDGWFNYGGSITRVKSGTNGISSADGSWHAEIVVGPSNGDGVFTRFGGYSSVFPAGGFSQLVDAYIDPAMGNIGEGWALDNALNGSNGVWIEAGGVGVLKANDGYWWLAADGDGAGYPGSINGGVGLRIDTAGWYTVESQWVENADDPSMIDRNTFIYDSEGNLLYSAYHFQQVALADAGGNRYGWFLDPSGPDWPAIQFPLPIDNSRLVQLVSPTGKATFGFVSKYKKGASVPDGQTEFVFQAADLNFHSSSYEWLVVAGSKAKFKGTGTINGEGEYKFMLTALDADINESDGFDVDRFRIKIWTEDAEGNETVVYDNALGDDSDDATTEIGGGSIVIHTKKK
jgi:parallel beta-helix repeat protein